MEKAKKKKIKLFGLKLKDLFSLASILAASFAAWHNLDAKIDTMAHRIDTIDHRIDNIEGQLKQTSGLLNNYLTWRFLYQHDPARKNIELRYDPNAKTLEFVNKNASKGE